MDSANIASELERESNILSMELTNLIAYTVHANVEGIKSKQLKEDGKWFIADYTNRKERAEFMISVLQKEVKRYKDY